MIARATIDAHDVIVDTRETDHLLFRAHPDPLYGKHRVSLLHVKLET